jgi:hypothetical protein
MSKFNYRRPNLIIALEGQKYTTLRECLRASGDLQRNIAQRPDFCNP